MDRPFTGFSSDRARTVRVPDGFFSDLLPRISSMLEMKVTLYLFSCLARAQEGAPRMVSHAELEQDADLRAALSAGKGPRTFEDALREGLELAVARGTLLQLRVREEWDGEQAGRDTAWYMLNTRDNRAWVETLAQGKVDVSLTPLAGANGAAGATAGKDNGGSGGSGANGKATGTAHPGNGGTRIRVIADRPNIYALYEQNIGLLTPILAEKLQDAEARYPAEWIADAFAEAVMNNKRNWRYIEKILERWAAEGKDSGKDRERAGRGLDPDKYTKGKYAFLFKRD